MTLARMQVRFLPGESILKFNRNCLEPLWNLFSGQQMLLMWETL